VFFVQGFSGHGVALTGLAGTILANHIMGQSRLFSILSKASPFAISGRVFANSRLGAWDELVQDARLSSPLDKPVRGG
jgi:hypothetical protein